MTDHAHEQLTEEEREKIRTRKSRGKWCAFYALAGFVFAVVAMWKFQALGFATLGMFVSMAGAGFVQPSEVKGFFGK